LLREASVSGWSWPSTRSLSASVRSWSAIASSSPPGPPLALVAVRLPDIDGFEVTSRLAPLDHAPAIVLVSSRNRAELEPLVPASAA